MPDPALRRLGHLEPHRLLLEERVGGFSRQPRAAHDADQGLNELQRCSGRRGDRSVLRVHGPVRGIDNSRQRDKQGGGAVPHVPPLICTDVHGCVRSVCFDRWRRSRLRTK